MSAVRKEKPKTPYQRLLEEVREFCRKAKWPHVATVWTYPKGRLREGWTLDALYERVQAAQQLGYEVHLEANDSGLRVLYMKKRPEPRSDWL